MPRATRQRGAVMVQWGKAQVLSRSRTNRATALVGV
jgi:hypothetical protein